MRALFHNVRLRRAVIILGVIFLFVVSFPLAGVKPTDALHNAASLLKAAFWDKGELIATIPLTPREPGAFPSSDSSNADVASVSQRQIKSSCPFATTESPTRGAIFFSEIAWMGNETSAQNEWIELANTSDSPVPINGWSVVDEGEQISFVFPHNATIPANSFILLERKEEAVPQLRADAIFSGGLRNSNEGVRLFDNDCNLVDQVLAHSTWPAGDNARKQTMERNFIDFSWYTSATTGGTPRAKNSSPPAPQTVSATPPTTQSEPEIVAPAPASTTLEQQLVVPTGEQEPTIPIQQQSCEQKVLISEIMAGSESSSLDEFLELYNPTSCVINLSGWTVKKRTSTGNESMLVAMSRLEGKSIPAESYFLLANEGGYTSAVQPDVWWPKSYTLAYANNAIVIYNADGAKIDEVSWTEIPKGQSWARISWNSNQFSIQNPNPQNSR